MAKFVTTQTNFSSGKLSKKLNGRPDIKEYANGMSVAKNCLLDPSGGSYKRQGLHYPNTILDSDTYEGAAKHFIVSPLDGYYFSIEISQNITSPLDGDKLQIWSLDSNGDRDSLVLDSYTETSLFEGTNGDYYHYSLASINNLYILTHASGKMPPMFFEIVDESTIEVYTLRGIDFRVLPHTTPLDASFGYNSQYGAPNTHRLVDTSGDASTMTELANTTLSIRQADYNTPTAGSYSYCYATIKTGNQIGDTVEVSSDSHLFQTGTYLADLAEANEVYGPDWGAGNWPFCCVTYQGRVIFLGSPKNPDKIWASRLNNPYAYNYIPYLNVNTQAEPVLDTDHFVFTISGLEGSKISNGKAFGSGICVGTTKGFHVIYAQQNTLSPFDFNVRRLDSVPVSYIAPVLADSYLVFAAENRRSMVLVVAGEDGLKYRSIELKHLYGELSKVPSDPTGGSIKEFSWDEENNICRALYGGGKALVLCINEQTGTIGITEEEYPVGIATMAYWKDGKSIAYTGGDVIRYITNDFPILIYSPGDIALGIGSPEQLRRSEGFAYTDAPFTTQADLKSSPITNDLYLDKEVWVGAWDALLEEVFYGKLTIPSDPGTLPDDFPDYEYLRIGVPIDMHIATMPIEAGGQIGTAQLGLKRVDKICVWYYSSTSFAVSSDGYNAEIVEIGLGEDNRWDSGRREIAFSASSEYDQRVHITHSDAGPCHVTSLSVKGLSNDG